MYDYLQIGKIANTQGLKGEIKVIPLTDNPERFDNLDWVFIGCDDGHKRYDIESVRYQKSSVILKLKGIDDIDKASELKSKFLLIDRSNAVPLGENAYFICDLIGCEVYEEGKDKLGTLQDIIKTGSNDVYIVRNDSGREVLIPALKSVVKDVSLSLRTITVVLPKGIADDRI
jgi:16S rRNA processing protein RimM